MKEKITHIICGALVSALIGLPVYLESLNLFAGVWSALLSGIIAGGIKEWCDTVYDNKWSWSDFGYTAIGASMVTLFIILLHIGKG